MSLRDDTTSEVWANFEDGSTDAKAELTDSLREDPTTPDTDQVVCLSTANELVEEMEDAREEWAKASAAGDVDTCFTH
ncbi:hypothetical protein [Streptomyces sp. NPDC050546]|uniref:hypothetical protein n=1 Tax=Streptomyces sp. NPDC050546 TaxID=3365628 RepID=UPI00379A4C2A